MDDCRLWKLHLWSIVTALAEIRILIDSAGNETWYFGDLFGVVTEDEREASGEGGGRLQCWEMEFRNVIAICKPESASDLVGCGSFAQFSDILVEGRRKGAFQELHIRKDECLFQVKAYSYDVCSILNGEFPAFLLRKLLVVEELLVICQHDDKRNIEDILEVSDYLVSFESANVPSIHT